MRKKTIGLLLVLLASASLAGCETTRGAVLGAGIGYVFGDAEFGAQVGATTGLIKDIWN